jgi:hypothetical protein
MIRAGGNTLRTELHELTNYIWNTEKLVQDWTNLLLYLFINRVKISYHEQKQRKSSLLKASKEVGLEVNTEKTKYMRVSRHQNVGKNHNLLIANRSFENVAPSVY